MACRIKHLKLTENEIQRQIVQGLTALGYVVLVTSRRVKRCRTCGNWQRGDDGATKGIPDLMVWRNGWDGWYGLEVKSPTGKVRPEQADLVHRGTPVVIVRSWEEALAATEEHAEAVMG